MARLGLSAPPSLITRKAIAWAASTKVFSFNIVSAWRGVFERTRRGQENSPEGESKAVKDGKGRERFEKVYMPRRKRSAPLVSGHVNPPYTVSPTLAGIGA